MKGTCTEEVEQWGPKSSGPCILAQCCRRGGVVSVGINVGRFAMGGNGAGEESNQGFFHCV